MPGPRCNVTFCNNINGKLNDDGKKITFHRFPKRQDLRNSWIEKCQRKGKWNVNYGYVCSEHFCKEDFKRDLQAELLGYKGRQKLKPFAMPSLNLPSGNVVINDINSYKNELEIKAKEIHKRLIKECLSENKETVPLSFATFKKMYKEQKKNKKIDCEDEYDSGLDQIEITHNNIRYKNLMATNSLVAVENQKYKSKLKRNIAIQKKMMEKIFLATLNAEPFSDTIEDDCAHKHYDNKAINALLKIFALAPKSYDKVAKRLNLPSKSILSTWKYS